jgi:hypothetical protein
MAAVVLLAGFVAPGLAAGAEPTTRKLAVTIVTRSIQTDPSARSCNILVFALYPKVARATSYSVHVEGNGFEGSYSPYGLDRRAPPFFMTGLCWVWVTRDSR